MNKISASRALFYSQYSFLKDSNTISSEYVEKLEESISKGDVEYFLADEGVLVFFRKLHWDSSFFGIPFFKIEFFQFSDELDFSFVKKAFLKFKEYISSYNEEFYIYSEVPSEDTRVITGLTGAGCKLIETRVTYYNDDIQNFSYSKRYPVRSAVLSDINELRKVAIESVNIYDRFHADDFYTEKESRNFMGQFIENSIKGFADLVIVPATGNANAFLTANYINTPSFLKDKKIGRMVLSAVSNERRGWYVKLISEMNYKFREQDVDTVFMTTQITNRTVLKVWQRLGFKFGRGTHIISTFKRNKLDVR